MTATQSEQNNDTGSPLKGYLKGAVLLATLGLLVWLARSLGLEDMVRDTHWFETHVLGKGPLSVFIYLGFTMVFTALGLPRQLTAFLGGMVFGWLGGSLLSTLATGLGCWLCAGYARLLGREFVCHRFGKRVAALDNFLRREPFNMALALRMFPIGSNLVTSLAAGVSSIPLGPFVAGSTVGYFPQSLVFALFGAGLAADSTLGVYLSIGVSVVLFVISTWLGISLYRRHRAELRAADEQAEQDETCRS